MNLGILLSIGFCNLLKFMFNFNFKFKHPINIQKIIDKTNLYNKKVNYFFFVFDYWFLMLKNYENLKNI